MSNHHLDALGRQTKNLTDEERSDLKDRTDELLDHAAAETAELFEKNLKAIITEIKDQYRPDSDLEELETQRRNSNVTDWVDKHTGMRKTLIELDPIRHDEWWRLYKANLNRLKAEPGSKHKTWQQLKVEAFLATTTGKVIKTRSNALPPANGAHGATQQWTEDGDARPVRRQTARRTSEIGATPGQLVGARE